MGLRLRTGPGLAALVVLKLGSLNLLSALPPQPQLRYQAPIAIDVLSLQVVEQSPPAPHHAQQAAPGVVVLGVCLEVFGEVGDPPRQKRHLDLGGPGVPFMGLVLSDDLVLPLHSQSH